MPNIIFYSQAAVHLQGDEKVDYMAEVAGLVGIRVLALGVTIVVFAIAIRYRDSPGAKGLGLLTGGLMIWYASEIALLLTTATVWSEAWFHLIFVGVAITIAGWGIFAITFTGYGGRYSRPAIWTLLVIMLVDSAIILTNPFHERFFSNFTVDETAWGITETAGTLWVIHLGYSYVVMVGGIVLVLALLYRSQSIYREQGYAIIAAGILPLVADMIYQFELLQLELTPLAIAASGALLGWAVFRFKFMRIAPVAQDTIVENIQDGILVLDRDGSVVEINDRAAAIFDIDPANRSTIDRSTLTTAVPAFAVAYDELTEDRMQTVDFSHDDSHFEVTLTTLFDHHDRRVARQFLFHDVTAQRQYQQILEQQNEQLDQFARVVTHDLRNPLNVARARLELAREQVSDENLEHVDKAHDRMESLIDEMLELTRDGHRVQETTCCSLEAIAKRAWAGVVTEDATLAVSEMDLVADDARLVQLFENLFRNVVEHAGPASHVRVGPLQSGFGFYVGDDGPGIPEDQREAVFEPNVSSSTDGSGLGLFIVETIVTAHGWTIEIEQSEKGGARFEISGVERC